ncbi:UNVERIFIED_CONTAM: hypothetical protein FKN15_036366 [Acipenser sinensis]
MAEASSLIHENQVTCSICLDIFTSPVSTPCGHSYCKNCIENHWDSGVYTCPLCKDEFHSRPNLNINRSLAEIAEQFRNSSIEEYDAQPGDVLCSFCLGRKLKAVKSCLQCLASYCEKHIKPHCEKPPFKRHTLLDPVEDFEGKVCNLHQQLLDIYCRTDQKLICHFCIDEEHKGHDLVTAKSERKEKQNMMEETQRRIKTRLQESREKLSSLNVVVGKVDDRAQREIEASNKIFDELINSTERIRAELLGKIRGEQNAARRPAEGPIQQLEQEIAALEWRNNVLEQLKQSEDHIHFLQNMMEETQRRIKTRLQESREKLSSLNVVVGKVDDRAQREIEASNKIFDELINSTERIRAELLGKIRGEQNAARRPAEGPIQQLEQEIAALEWRNNVLEQLKQSEDHIHFLQDRAQREIEASNKIFDELINSTERIRAELLGKIRGEQNAARRPAEGPIQQLEQEIAALEWRNNVLEQLKQSEDHIHFLQMSHQGPSKNHLNELCIVRLKDDISVLHCPQKKRRYCNIIRQDFGEEEELIPWINSNATARATRLFNTQTPHPSLSELPVWIRILQCILVPKIPCIKLDRFVLVP